MSVQRHHRSASAWDVLGYARKVDRSYFDAVAAQPLHPVAARALRQSSEHDWADPTANYLEAATARQLRQASRETIAALIDVEPDRVVFRQAGPDATALVTGLAAGGCDRSHVGVATAVERLALLDAIEAERPLVRVKVDLNARVAVDAMACAVARRPAFVAAQVANNEFGTLQPMAEIGSLCRASGVPLLADATGALGIHPLPSDWDLLIAGARGWAGPREVAVVVIPAARAEDVRDTVPIRSAVATAAALDAVWREAGHRVAILRALSERIASAIATDLPDAVILGAEAERLPNIVALILPGVDGTVVQAELDAVGIAVGTGSACNAAEGRPSHVLQATGHPPHGSIRISLPWLADDSAVNHLVSELPRAVARAAARVTGATP